MRTIANRSISILISLVLSTGLLVGSLVYPRKAHAILPVLGGAAAAVGATEVAEIGAFAALLAAAGFSLAASVGANPDVPIADWSNGQLTDAQRKAMSAAQYREWLDLTYFLNNSPNPPGNDGGNNNGKKQPKKEDATSDLDYMISMLIANGAIGLTGTFADGIETIAKWATTPENEGGGGFSAADSVIYPELDFEYNGHTGHMVVGETTSTAPVPDGYSFIYRTISGTVSYNYACKVGTASINRVSTYDDGTILGIVFNYADGTGYYWNKSYRPQEWHSTRLSDGIWRLDDTVFSPEVARMFDASYQPITMGGLLYQIAGQNAEMQNIMQQMQNDTSAAVAALKDLYANDVRQTEYGTKQYTTVQAPYYISSGQTDPSTGAYTAKIVANDHNLGTISKYDDAVATDTSSPQPGNTNYIPDTYNGNSSSDVPPWKPLQDIHLDRVWPFSLIGDSYVTFKDVFSMDGGASWDWHITVPLSKWNIALGGAAVFDDYDLDLSMWRDLFVYLAPWFLLFVFLALLDMARRLWLRWNHYGGDD